MDRIETTKARRHRTPLFIAKCPKMGFGSFRTFAYRHRRRQSSDNKNMTRRTLLGYSAMPVLSALAAAARPKIAVSTYSYWHFRTEKYPIERVIENAAKLGFDGVEILHRQMADETPAYCNKLKQLAFQHGLAHCRCYPSIRTSFIPTPAERRKHIEHTEQVHRPRRQLGIPAIRLNSGPLENHQVVRRSDEGQRQ